VNPARVFIKDPDIVADPAETTVAFAKVLIRDPEIVAVPAASKVKGCIVPE
jgi:hypothetical protein